MAGGETSSARIDLLGVSLAVGTLLVTAVAALPAFLALRGKEPHVVYQLNRTEILYPQDSNPAAVRALLEQNGIPDASLAIKVSNRGDVPAERVVIGVKVQGRLLADRSEPAAGQPTAWVSVVRDSMDAADSSSIRYILSDMGLRKEYSLKVSYITQEPGAPSIDVFYDGRPAHEVADIASVPDNARAVSLKPALQVFVAALIASLLIYLFVRSRQANLVMFTRRILAKPHWVRYKNEVTLHVASSPGAILESFTDGDADANEPEELWDAIVKFDNFTVAFDVHTDEQHFPAIRSEGPAQREFALKLHSMAMRTPGLTHVAVVNKTDIWKEGVGAEFTSLLGQLARAAGRPEYIFLHGAGEKVALDLRERLPQQLSPR